MRRSNLLTRIVGPRGNRRWRRFLVAPVLLPMVIVFMLIGLAQAAPDDNGLFELDGNVHDQPVAGDDWSNIFNNTDSSFTDTGIVADPSPQSIFTGGGSKDDLDIPQWQHKNGNVPDKDDITDAYAAAYTLAGDTFVYFGLDRFAVQGSANVGFWFFQNDVAPIPGTPPGSTSTFSGVHEVGDLLVLSEFDQGGGGVSIKVLEWVGTGGDEGGGTLQTLFGGETGSPADCDSTGVTANVCANVNTAPLVDADIPWNYVGKGGTRNMPTAAFFEGGINLDAFFGDAPCFTNVVAETRSSFEVNAVLKDLVHSQFELCEADISIEADDVNDVGDQHTFTVDVSTSVAGNPTPVPDGTIVDVTLTHSNPAGVVDLISDTCATGTVGGSCTVTFSSDEPGVITGHAEADVEVGGTTIHVSTGSGPGQNPDAFKVFVDATISISPDDVNGIGEDHTFVVAVQQDSGDGNGLVDATDGHVDFTLTPSGGAVPVLDAAASTCDDPGDNLDANGECTIVFRSDTAGSVVGHASVAVTISTTEGDITVNRQTDGSPGNTGDATKEFVDGTLRWLKHDQDGNLLGGAVFSVCRTHDFDSDTNTFVDIDPDVCVDVTDNLLPDTDLTDGEFQLEHLILGRYTIKELTPPPGYAPDPDTETVDLTVDNPSNADDVGGDDPPLPVFVNERLFKVIVITCNDSVDPEVLVDSTVTINSGLKETITAVPAHLDVKGVTQADLCAIGGASYGDLPANPNLDADIELPDVAPLFP